MNAAGIIRFRKWEANNKKPMRPLTDCVYAVFCGVSYVGFDGITLELERALKAIDPNFEIIYDRCTASGNLEPAFHLYRRVAGSAGSPERRLRLEFSLQKDCGQQWPLGVPRLPGMWVIDEIRKHDKRQMSGDAEKDARTLLKQSRDQEIAETEKADREAAEPIEHFQEECQKVIDGKVNLKGRSKLRRSPKSPKVQARIVTPAQFTATEKVL